MQQPSQSGSSLSKVLEATIPQNNARPAEEKVHSSAEKNKVGVAVLRRTHEDSTVLLWT